MSEGKQLARSLYIPINCSADLGELATALAKAQLELTGVKRESENPFFKSKYADLGACWDALREPLGKNGISVIQLPGNDGDRVTLTTILMHQSGQFIASELGVVPDKPGCQPLGLVLSYLRRYSLCAVTGLAQVDDDAEGATLHGPAKKGPSKVLTQEQLAKIIETETMKLDDAAQEGSAAFSQQWAASSDCTRKALQMDQGWLDDTRHTTDEKDVALIEASARQGTEQFENAVEALPKKTRERFQDERSDWLSDCATLAAMTDGEKHANQ